MPFHHANDWKERGLQLQSVKDKCNEIIKALNLPEDHVRTQGMIHVRQFCNSLALVPIKLSQNAEITNNVPLIMTLLGLNQKKDLKSCLVDLNDNSKASFITMAQFALENCIERVLDALPSEKSQGTFSRSSKRLISITQLPNQSTKHEILLVPAWIRNTLHAAGIHGHASRTVMIDGEPYQFEKGKRVSCTSWSHVFHAFRNGLEIYEELLLAPAVKSIGRIPVVP